MMRMRERVSDNVAKVCDKKEYGAGLLHGHGSLSRSKMTGSTESDWYTGFTG